MPESRGRKKTVYTPPPTRSDKKKPSPVWVAPLMLALFIIGLLWLVTYYVIPDGPLIGALGGWNLAIGFGFIVGGFVVSTQWR